MIKRKFDIVPVCRSVKKFNSGMLVKNQQTGQFGVINPSSLRGSQARRHLRDSFEPVSLYVVEIDREPEFDDFVITSYGNGYKIVGKAYEFGTELDHTNQQAVFLYPGELLGSLTTVDNKVFIPFKTLTSKTVNTLLQSGGHIWMEMNPDNTPKLRDGKHMVHLSN